MRLDPKTVHAPEIGPVWLNSPPLSPRQLRRRVVQGTAELGLPYSVIDRDGYMLFFHAGEVAYGATLEDLSELGGAWHSLADMIVSPAADSGLAELVNHQSGEPVGVAARGVDVELRADGQPVVRVTRPRMYSLIRGGQFARAILAISCAVRSVQVFATTFGSCLEGVLETA